MFRQEEWNEWISSLPDKDLVGGWSKSDWQKWHWQQIINAQMDVEEDLVPSDRRVAPRLDEPGETSSSGARASDASGPQESVSASGAR